MKTNEPDNHTEHLAQGNKAVKKEPKLLRPLAHNLEETAQVIGISKRAIRRLVKRRLLRPSKATRCFIFSRAEIERFLAETTCR